MYASTVISLQACVLFNSRVSFIILLTISFPNPFPLKILSIANLPILRAGNDFKCRFGLLTKSLRNLLKALLLAKPSSSTFKLSLNIL